MITKFTLSEETITCEKFNCNAIVRTVIYPKGKTYREVEYERNCMDCKYGRTDKMRMKEILKSLRNLLLTDI